MREINAAGLALLKRFEACKLTSYKDEGGIWTIGYGHTGPEVTQGMMFTPEQAEMQLKKDLQEFYHLDHYLSEQVNDNQWSALICLAYNIGLGGLKRSTLIRCINDGDIKGIKQNWLSWDHVEGVVSNGLLNRRKAELALFNTLD